MTRSFSELHMPIVSEMGQQEDAEDAEATERFYSILCYLRSLLFKSVLIVVWNVCGREGS